MRTEVSGARSSKSRNQARHSPSLRELLSQASDLSPRYAKLLAAVRAKKAAAEAADTAYEQAQADWELGDRRGPKPNDNAASLAWEKYGDAEHAALTAVPVTLQDLRQKLVLLHGFGPNMSERYLDEVFASIEAAMTVPSPLTLLAAE